MNGAYSRPSPYLLALLACVYGCSAGDLIDLADREQLPPADLLILDTYSQEIHNSATKTVRPNHPTHQHRLRRNNPCPRCQPSPTVESQWVLRR
ncbi:MAG TPA: hypothetical protein VF933_16320 [Streptosporangiaceae bacterium]